MKSDHPAKVFLVAFLLALVVYVVFYVGIEHRRTRKGPWQVTFTTSADGSPAIILNQPKLGITNVQINFPGQTLPATNAVESAQSTEAKTEGRTTYLAPQIAGRQLPLTLLFDKPQAVPYEVPFGQCIFIDLISLPGTVAFKLYGHEIELLPRVLTIDRVEHPWRSGATISLPRS